MIQNEITYVQSKVLSLSAVRSVSEKIQVLFRVSHAYYTEHCTTACLHNSVRDSPSNLFIFLPKINLNTPLIKRLGGICQPQCLVERRHASVDKHQPNVSYHRFSKTAESKHPDSCLLQKSQTILDLFAL